MNRLANAITCCKLTLVSFSSTTGIFRHLLRSIFPVRYALLPRPLLATYLPSLRYFDF
jgi:hypothetical protein